MKILISITLLFLFSFSSAWALPECEGNYRHNCQGTVTYTNGDKYVGEFKDNKKHGQGIYTSTPARGYKYVGEYKDGERNGQGTYTWSNGDKYVGEWKNSKRHGEGTMFYASGDKRKATFKNGKKHGKALYTFADGRTDEEMWIDGVDEEVIITERRKKEVAEIERKELERKRKVQERKREIEREKERKRLAIIRKENDLKVDNCLLKIFKSEEEWSENNARRLCRMAVVDSTSSLMSNCILDRGYKKPSSIYSSVFNVCESIASKPSWKDKIKYATPLSEYLNKLK